MATFLDVVFLEKFGAIFSFLLVFVVLLGILSAMKAFGDNKLLHFIIPFVIAIVVLLSPTAIGMIEYMAPWFVVLFFFITFILIAYKMFGITDEHIVDTVRKGTGIQWAVFIVGIVILLAAFSANLGKAAFPYLEEGKNVTTVNGEPSVATEDIGRNVAATIFHPKVLGMLAILLIATAAIGLLGGRKIGSG